MKAYKILIGVLILGLVLFPLVVQLSDDGYLGEIRCEDERKEAEKFLKESMISFKKETLSLSDCSEIDLTKKEAWLILPLAKYYGQRCFPDGTSAATEWFDINGQSFRWRLNIKKSVYKSIRSGRERTLTSFAQNVHLERSDGMKTNSYVIGKWAKYFEGEITPKPYQGEFSEEENRFLKDCV